MTFFNFCVCPEHTRFLEVGVAPLTLVDMKDSQIFPFFIRIVYGVSANLESSWMRTVGLWGGRCPGPWFLCWGVWALLRPVGSLVPRPPSFVPPWCPGAPRLCDPFSSRSRYPGSCSSSQKQTPQRIQRTNLEILMRILRSGETSKRLEDERF